MAHREEMPRRNLMHFDMPLPFRYFLYFQAGTVGRNARNQVHFKDIFIPPKVQ